MERTAHTDFAFHPEASIHHFHQPGADGKSETRSAMFAGHRAVSLREGFEDLLLRLARDAHPGVLHLEVQFRSILAPPDLADTHQDLALFRKLDGIAYQVDE